MSKSQAPEIIVMLNDVRSSENVGAIFRTCDAAGVSEIFLCGYTPAPLDRFGRANKKIAKAALGAEKTVKWRKFSTLKKAVASLKNQKDHPSTNGLSDLKIIGIEQDKRAVDYKKILKNKFESVALIFGNEVSGLSTKDLSYCDIVAQLPMKGRKESLNVSVCAGIVLYSLI